MILLIAEDPLNIVSANFLINLTENNKHSVTYYFNNPDLKTAADQLIILDLRANREFQAMFEGETFAKKLHDFGLSSSIKTIDLLVSDIEADDVLIDSIPQFAATLANTLQESYQLDIKIRIVSDPHFLTTLLVPPSEASSEWMVYGINDSLKDKQTNYATLINNENKKLIWKGKDITTWLNHPQRIFISQAKQLKLS